ncbi:MAG: hypothetical protein AAFN78_09440 [Pseudomonadota bacterium]
MNFALQPAQAHRRARSDAGISAGAGAVRPGPAGLCEPSAHLAGRNSLRTKFNGTHGHSARPVWKPYGLTTSWWLKHADTKATPMWQVLRPGQGCRYIIEGRYKPHAEPAGIIRISRNQRYLGGGGEFDITALRPGTTTVHAVDRTGTCFGELQISVVETFRRTLRFCYLANEDGDGVLTSRSSRSGAALAAVLREANGILSGWTGLEFVWSNNHSVPKLRIGDSLARGYDTQRHRALVMADARVANPVAAHVYLVDRFTNPNMLGFAHISDTPRTRGAIILSDRPKHPGTVLAHELVHLLISSPADRAAAGMDAEGHSASTDDLMYHGVEFDSGAVTGTRIPRQQATFINPSL